MKTTTRRLLAALAAGLALAVAATAARADTEPLVLTLEEAMKAAAGSSPEVVKAREYGTGVAARYVEERSAAFPHFTFTASGSRSEDESQSALGFPVTTDNGAVKVLGRQPLFTWGQISSAIRLADINRATAGDRLAAAQATSARDAAAAFYGVLFARELESLARQNLEQKQRLLDEATRRLAAGTATDYDVLAASVGVQNARPEVISSGNAVRDARERLAFVLGERDRPVDVVGSLQAPVAPAPDAATALQTAVARRPELAEMRKNVAMSKELVRIESAGNKPRLDLAADAGWRTVDMDGRAGDGTTWSAGLLLSWPAFDGGRTRGAVARRESEVRTLGLEEARFIDALALDTRTGVDAVNQAAAIVEALGGTVAQAERLLAMAEKGFELGVKTRIDVNDAQLNLVSARAGLARGRRDLLVARVNLDWLMGTLTPAP
ncbi:MAG TPA: TolC family protein [bacterium]